MGEADRPTGEGGGHRPGVGGAGAQRRAVAAGQGGRRLARRSWARRGRREWKRSRRCSRVELACGCWPLPVLRSGSRWGVRVVSNAAGLRAGWRSAPRGPGPSGPVVGLEVGCACPSGGGGGDEGVERLPGGSRSWLIECVDLHQRADGRVSRRGCRPASPQGVRPARRYHRGGRNRQGVATFWGRGVGSASGRIVAILVRTRCPVPECPVVGYGAKRPSGRKAELFEGA